MKLLSETFSEKGYTYKQGEEWRFVSEWPAYEVSSIGRVRRDNKIVSQRLNGKGYFRVNLSCNGDCQHGVMVHRLVCAAFNPNPFNLPMACHNNGASNDNRADNLYWGTAEQNAKDKIRHGTVRIGWSNPATKLSLSDVRFIRFELANNPKFGKAAKLARQFGVSKQLISRIKLHNHRQP